MAHYVNYYHILGFLQPQAGSYRHITQAEIDAKYIDLMKILTPRRGKENTERIALVNQARDFLQEQSNRDALNLACEQCPEEVIADEIRFSTINTVARIHWGRDSNSSEKYDAHQRLLQSDLNEEEFFLAFMPFNHMFSHQMAQAAWYLASDTRRQLTQILVDCFHQLGRPLIPNGKELILGLCEYLVSPTADDANIFILREFLINLMEQGRPEWPDQAGIANHYFINNFTQAQLECFIQKFEVGENTEIPSNVADWLRQGDLHIANYIRSTTTRKLLARADGGIVHLIQQHAVECNAIATCENAGFLNNIEIAKLIDDVPFDPAALIRVVYPINSAWTQPQRFFIAHMVAIGQLNPPQVHDIPTSLINFVFGLHQESNAFRRELLLDGLYHVMRDGSAAYILSKFNQEPSRSTNSLLLDMTIEGLRQDKWGLSQYLMTEYLQADQEHPTQTALLRDLILNVMLHCSDVRLLINPLGGVQSQALFVRLDLVPAFLAEEVMKRFWKNTVTMTQLNVLSPPQKNKLKHEKGMVSLLKREVIDFSDLAKMDIELLNLFDDEDLASRLHGTCWMIPNGIKGDKTFLTFYVDLAIYPWPAEHKVVMANLALNWQWQAEHFKYLTPLLRDVLFHGAKVNFHLNYSPIAIYLLFSQPTLNSCNQVYQELSSEDRQHVCPFIAAALVPEDRHHVPPVVTGELLINREYWKSVTLARVFVTATMPLTPPMLALQRLIRGMLLLGVENNHFIDEFSPAEISAFFRRWGIDMPDVAPSHFVTALTTNELPILFFIDRCSCELQQALLENKGIARLIPQLKDCDAATLQNLSAKDIAFLNQEKTANAILISHTSIAEFMNEIAKFREDLDDAKKIEYYLHRQENSRRFATCERVLTATNRFYSTTRDPIGIINSIIYAPAIVEVMKYHENLNSNRIRWKQKTSRKLVDSVVTFLQSALMNALAAVLDGAKKTMTPAEVQASFDAHFAQSFAQLHASTEPSKIAMLDFLFKEKPELIEQLTTIFLANANFSLSSPLIWIGYRQSTVARESYVNNQISVAVRAAKKEYDTPKPATTPAEPASGFSAMCSTSTAVQIATHGTTGQRRSEELVEAVTALRTAGERLAYLRNFLDNYSFLTGPWKDGSFKPCLVEALVNHFGSGALRQAFAKIVFSPSTDEAKPQAMSIFLQLEQELLHTIERPHQAVAATTTVSSTHRPAS